ncbi:Glycosyl transferase family 90 [Mucilaginibacter pineti]|uniref:Glycosyl transferase family 90 n=1 Tax=Mucilaginibacter pineti TaxID=1391627 RepID=A0A1G6XTE8_9SPHI|nr:glycosyl transferase family 90 [Mucilaginibacter pineti]SDD81410.1 Glycosyl transferase family 90 [Mucilaginibacter pineti]
MMFSKTGIEIKRNKLPYYAKNFLRQLIPTFLHEALLNTKLAALKKYDKTYIADRVNYYNKLKKQSPLGQDAIMLKDLPVFKKPKAYHFDTFEYIRYFKKSLKASFLFGDITHVANAPALQKSRPIEGDNANAVLLKLDKKRHFLFINDPVKFEDKKDMLIGRGVMSQPHRMRFMEMYFDNPLCNLGQVNKTGGNTKWLKPKIKISDHLTYKFILSLEGNDVATNLKWIMSSNSIAVMPRPKYETWFMEGRLIPDHHYILIADDYSDLAEKLDYYISHPQAAQTIVHNANAFAKQFKNKPQEDLISLLVLQKYFYYTSQTDQFSI